MIVTPALASLSPSLRADLIFREARGRTDDLLWRSAFGGAEQASAAPPSVPSRRIRELTDFVRSMAEATELSAAPPPDSNVVADSLPPLGPNRKHARALIAAAERTGLPASALAAIVGAESAKRSDGSWNPLSRNPRSSAAGIGQFLSGTWIGEAERKGTWLNRCAGERGWLSSSGRVRPDCRGMLLELRYQPEAAINAVADYAASNLRSLRKAGVDVGESAAQIARSAYLGHHLGPGDAVRFLKGGLADGRAQKLLEAQVGTGVASRRIAALGDASAAHREWLLTYVDRHLRTESRTG